MQSGVTIEGIRAVSAKFFDAGIEAAYSAPADFP
jgi:hypothetical protein